jgi:hypothetical protein
MAALKGQSPSTAGEFTDGPTAVKKHRKSARQTRYHISDNPEYHKKRGDHHSATENTAKLFRETFAGRLSIDIFRKKVIIIAHARSR